MLCSEMDYKDTKTRGKPDQSEIASPQNRGRIITLYQLGVTVGYCLSNWIAYGTVNMDGHDAWR